MFKFNITDTGMTMETTARTNIKPINEASLDGGIKITASLDMRYNGREKLPVVVRVTYRRERFIYATGAKVTPREYERILQSYGIKGEIGRARRSIQEVFDRVRGNVEALIRSGRFSLANLRAEMKPKVKDVAGASTLYELWQDFADSKSLKTGDQYRQACISFFKSRGCRTGRVLLEDGSKSRKMELLGRALKMKPREVTSAIINEWVDTMSESGNSTATIAMNLRAMKALLNSLIDAGTISELPKFTIKAGGKRDEDVIPVRDILRIMAYDGERKAQADWFIIVYLMNGANIRDLSELKWSESYEYDNTLSFIRHKTRGKSPSKVVVPVIPELQTLLDKYAAPFKPGELVFPDIFGTAVSESQKLSRVHDFCAWIREGMAEVCRSLNIRPATVNTARHTFATVLKAHGIPTEYIDIAMGHSRKEISSFYVTMFAESRQRINSCLLKEPQGIPRMTLSL